MSIIKSYKDLLEIYNKTKHTLDNRLNTTNNTNKEEKKQILVCGGTGCQSADSQVLLENFQNLIIENKLEDKVNASITGCFGFCAKGPIVKIFPDDVFYVEVTPEDAKEIFESQIVNNVSVERLLFVDPNTNKVAKTQHEMPFYKKQKRIALRNCGIIDPEKIEEYIANKGYTALGNVLVENNPDGVIEIMKQSGLRGRGGGGFPTGVKWGIAQKEKSDIKYMICNADEGDPGAFMDRSIMEGDPHSVLEAMAIGGYAIGASVGYIYIRAEYELAIERIKTAIEQAIEKGLIGKNILGTGFDFDIELKYGAGAFVCGEETALIHSIEGRRGEPTFKPPFPAIKGLWKKPTIVNNVETFSNIPPIILNGAEWFSSIGTEKSKGTKVFALAGQINNVGLVEVPMGITLREIIFEIGGGIPDGLEFKAVQTGGPSGGCLSKDQLDIPIDYDSLKSIGSMMGSGGMIVLSENDCMVDIAKFFLDFTMEESCSKCTPCRIGNKRLYEMLTDICEGRGTMETIQKLKDLSATIKDTALCGLGQTSPNPVLSTLATFENEYIAHVQDKKCPAGVCEKLITFEINDKCIGCTLCARNCPVECISGEKKGMHIINQNACVKCGLCYDACKFKAIDKK